MPVVRYNICNVCGEYIKGFPEKCDWCNDLCHDDCMGPPHSDEVSGDIYNYCVSCESNE
jgi:hypothetical protein